MNLHTKRRLFGMQVLSAISLHILNICGDLLPIFLIYHVTYNYSDSDSLKAFDTDKISTCESVLSFSG